MHLIVVDHMCLCAALVRVDDPCLELLSQREQQLRKMFAYFLLSRQCRRSNMLTAPSSPLVAEMAPLNAAATGVSTATSPLTVISRFSSICRRTTFSPSGAPAAHCTRAPSCNAKVNCVEPRRVIFLSSASKTTHHALRPTSSLCFPRLPGHDNRTNVMTRTCVAMEYVGRQRMSTPSTKSRRSCDSLLPVLAARLK